MKVKDKGKEYKVIFKVDGALDDNWSKQIIEHTKHDFVNGYNTYCKMANNGLIEMLNLVFDMRYPEYAKQDDAEDYQTAYNDWMREGFQQLCDTMNSQRVSQIFDFYVTDELQFKGKFRLDPSITMWFNIE